MGVCYLCPVCAETLSLHGFDTVNEVGRKHCEGCGENKYDNLMCVDEYECGEQIKKYNKKAQERLTKKK
jgi:hypothetical protein